MLTGLAFVDVAPRVHLDPTRGAFTRTGATGMRQWLKTRFNGHGFTINEATRARNEIAGRRRWLLYRRMFLHFDLAAPLACRIFGHRPVVYGTGAYGSDRGNPCRWIECGRCDARATNGFGIPAELHPQIHAAYRGPVVPDWPTHRRCEMSCEIALPAPRLWLRSWTFGFKVGVGGSRESTVSVDLHVGPLSVYLRQSNVFGMRWARRTAIYWNPEVSFAVGRFDRQVHVTWCLWCDPSGPTGEKPVGLRPDRVKIAGWRYGYFHPVDKLLGRYKTDRGIVASMDGTITLPEGRYVCRVALERLTARRARWPRAKVWYRLDVTPDRPIPTPGNLDSDFYDGDDATHAMSCGYTGPLDLTARQPAFVAEGLRKLTESVLATRRRHGGSTEWQPKQDAST